MFGLNAIFSVFVPSPLSIFSAIRSPFAWQILGCIFANMGWGDCIVFVAFIDFRIVRYGVSLELGCERYAKMVYVPTIWEKKKTILAASLCQASRLEMHANGSILTWGRRGNQSLVVEVGTIKTLEYHLSQNYYITARYFWTINVGCRDVKITSQKLPRGNLNRALLIGF